MIDISPQNILIKDSENLTSLQHIEQQEAEHPSDAVTSDGAHVHSSRVVLGQVSGIPVLTDFGMMRTAEPANTDWWMTDLYRAPEVLLGHPWETPADIFAIGVVVSAAPRSAARMSILTPFVQTLELLEGKNVFQPIDYEHHQYVLPLALAQYIGLLGHPPTSMILPGTPSAEHFDEQGEHFGLCSIDQFLYGTC